MTMFKRPPMLILVSTILVITALGFPAQIMWIYGHGLEELPSIWSKLTWLNMICIFFCLLNAHLLLQASMIVHFTIPWMFVLMALNNWAVSYAGTDFSILQTASATFVFVLLHIPLLEPKTRAVLTDRRKRWWMRSSRKQLETSVVVCPHRGPEFEATTYDISDSGIFVPHATQIFKEMESSQKLVPGNMVSLRIILDQLRSIRCEGLVVRTSLATGNYPSGFGIRFSKLSSSDKKSLSLYLN